MKVAYKVIVRFTRLFIRGSLKGIKHTDGIPHVDRWHAAQWLKGIRRNTRAGSPEYKIIAAETFKAIGKGGI